MDEDERTVGPEHGENAQAPAEAMLVEAVHGDDQGILPLHGAKQGRQQVDHQPVMIIGERGILDVNDGAAAECAGGAQDGADVLCGPTANQAVNVDAVDRFLRRLIGKGLGQYADFDAGGGQGAGEIGCVVANAANRRRIFVGDKQHAKLFSGTNHWTGRQLIVFFAN